VRRTVFIRGAGKKPTYGKLLSPCLLAEFRLSEVADRPVTRNATLLYTDPLFGGDPTTQLTLRKALKRV
jgi:hypothetical protein